MRFFCTFFLFLLYASSVFAATSVIYDNSPDDEDYRVTASIDWSSVTPNALKSQRFANDNLPIQRVTLRFTKYLTGLTFTVATLSGEPKVPFPGKIYEYLLLDSNGFTPADVSYVEIEFTAPRSIGDKTLVSIYWLNGTRWVALETQLNYEDPSKYSLTGRGSASVGFYVIGIRDEYLKPAEINDTVEVDVTNPINDSVSQPPTGKPPVTSPPEDEEDNFTEPIQPPPRDNKAIFGVIILIIGLAAVGYAITMYFRPEQPQ